MRDLSTRTARRKVPYSKDKVWVRLSRGRALGYRRPSSDSGTWYVRLFFGGSYRMSALGTADDVAEADGNSVLNHPQATNLALSWHPDVEHPNSGSLTVQDAVDRYLEWYQVHRRSYDHVSNVFRSRVLPELGHWDVKDLTAHRMRQWHQSLAQSPARLRGGQLRKARSEDEKRARKVSANRALTALKAALTRAVDDGLAEGPGAWGKVKPFRGVEMARTGYLEQEALHRLLNSCPLDFRALVRAALHTGARLGELAELRVRDYLPEAEAIHISKTKIGTARHVYLSEEAVGFFDSLTAGRRPQQRLLIKEDGSPWGRNHQARRMSEACAKAEISPPVGFHQLRHTYASLYLMNGGSLIALAKQLGHTTTRMVEKHYGHLADSWRAAEARKHAPRLGVEKSKVQRIGIRR